RPGRRGGLSTPADRPADSLEQMEAEALVLPDLAAVTQGGVKHATTSVSPDPGDRVVLVGPLSLADVDRAGIELQQHVDLVPRPVSELVDLVGDLEAGSEVLRRGMGGILDHEPHALGPRVAVERSEERRVGKECRCRWGTM